MTGIVVRWPKHIRRACKCNGERQHCVYCAGYSFTCATCRASDGELTVDCPGYELAYAIREAVYADVMDYDRRRGWWRVADGAVLSNPPKG